MTTINRRLKRETSGTVFSNGQRRAVIVIIEPPGTVLTFRLKGERHAYSLPTEFLYKQAVTAQVLSDRRAKREAKKGRRR